MWWLARHSLLSTTPSQATGLGLAHLHSEESVTEFVSQADKSVILPGLFLTYNIFFKHITIIYT